MLKFPNFRGPGCAAFLGAGLEGFREFQGFFSLVLGVHVLTSPGHTQEQEAPPILVSRFLMIGLSRTPEAGP